MAGEGGGLQAAYLASTRVLGSIAGIRPEERRHALGAFLTLFGFLAGHALLETARDALFLASWPASQLPWVYLAIAVFALLLTQSRPRFIGRISTRNELSAWLVFSAAVTFGFWLIAGWAGGWVYYALYTWSGVLATLVVVRFWTVLGNLFTVTQAKRLFAVIGSGSVLGAIVGSGAARVLTEQVAARHIVLSAAIVFLLSSLGPSLLGRDHAAPAGPRQRWDPAALGRFVWSRPYLRRVGVLILISTITVTLVDFVFKSAVARHVPDEQLAEFFSSVYFGLNLVSLFVQVFVVRWLLRRMGVNLVQAVMPALLLVSGLGFVVGGGLLAALILKSADGSLRYSLYRTGTELLFVPLSVDVRGRVKAFIDVLGQRGGQALASLLILGTLAVTTRETVFVASAGISAAVWLVLALDLRKHYLDVFRETLSRDITETRIEFPALDLASLETLLATLNEPDDRRIVAALDLLAAQEKVRVIPALILYHPSSRVVVHALDLFLRSGRTDFLPIVTRLLGHADPEVVAAGLRVLSVLTPDERTLRRHLGHVAPEVQATALVGLVAGGWLGGEAARDELLAAAEAGSVEAGVALARAIRHQPAAVFDAVLVRLASAPEAAVRLEAVRAMREVRSPNFVASLIALQAERALRDDARAALVALGPIALSRLAAALRDGTIAHDVRRHVPGAIAAFGSAQAAEIMVQRLPVEPDGMIRYKLIQALGRLRSEHPGVPISGTILHQSITQTLSAGFSLLRWRQAIEHGAVSHAARQTAVHDVIVTLLRDKQGHALDRLLRLLALQTNNDDFARINRGLQSDRRETRAGSRELVEHLVLPPLRERVLELVDDLYDAAPAHRDSSPASVDAYDGVLRELIQSGNESLSSLAAWHAAELELRHLSPHLAPRSEFSPLHEEVLRHARELLLRSSGPEVIHG